MLYNIQGTDVAGTTEYIYYDDGGIYTLLGSTNNTTCCSYSMTGSP